MLLRYTGITVSTTAQGTFTVVAQATSASPDTNATNNAAFLNLRADALQVVLTLPQSRPRQLGGGLRSLGPSPRLGGERLHCCRAFGFVRPGFNV